MTEFLVPKDEYPMLAKAIEDGTIPSVSLDEWLTKDLKVEFRELKLPFIKIQLPNSNN